MPSTSARTIYGDPPEGLLPKRHQQDVGRRQQVRHVGALAEKPDPVGDPELRRQGRKALAEGDVVFATAGARELHGAGEQEHDVAARGDQVPQDHDRFVLSLDGRDMGQDGEDEGIGGDAEFRPHRPSVGLARVEATEVDRVVDDAYGPAWRAGAEPGGDIGRVGDDRIGAPGDQREDQIGHRPRGSQVPDVGDERGSGPTAGEQGQQRRPRRVGMDEVRRQAPDKPAELERGLRHLQQAAAGVQRVQPEAPLGPFDRDRLDPQSPHRRAQLPLRAGDHGVDPSLQPLDQVEKRPLRPTHLGRLVHVEDP
jgi:hypothetical protein